MSTYIYEAVDATGLTLKGGIDVADQSEALARIKEMGLFPTKIAERRKNFGTRIGASGKTSASRKGNLMTLRLFGGRVKSRTLAGFTRQLATLTDAGMPLLRGLRLLREQEKNQSLRRIIGEISASIESGSSLSEALAFHPKTFDNLYINMVKAGELGGALELTMLRLAEFMEKAQRIKGKVKSAMFYPAAVMFVAVAIMTVMMVFVVPRFKEVFSGLLDGAQMPVFTTFILNISDVVRHNFLMVVIAAFLTVVLGAASLRTVWGRKIFDRLKLTAPVIGGVFTKAAISRFARTLGTLLNSGVPVLQALNIVKETAGNVVVRNVVKTVHDDVKEGGTIAAHLKASKVFPSIVAGMVDVGEQTGALPDMLLKIADNYDEDVDNSVSAMTSVLEPIMIVFLAAIVGSIVIAMFLPIITAAGNIGGSGGTGDM